MTAEPSIYTPADITKRRSLMDSSEAKEKYKQRCEFHRLLRKNCTPNEYSIFCSLDDRASEINDGWCFPSYDTIMEDCNIQNRNAVTTALIRLFDLELIEWCLDGRQGCYRPVQPDSTVLERLSYQINTKDSINSVLSIVSKRYSNGTNRTINKINDPTTPNGVVAPPAETEIEIQEEITPDPSPDKKVTDPTTPALFAVPGKNGHGEPGQVGSQKPKKKPEVKERDPTLDHFAVVAWHEMVVTVSEGRDGAWPNPVQRKLIASNVPDTPEDRERWGKVLSYWARHNYQMRNIPQLLDVFFNGNGNGKKPGKT